MSSQDQGDPRVPVDRGWAWMVLAGSFALSTINVGTEKSYEIFFIEFLRKFNGTVSMTAMINAVLDIVFCICSVLVLNVGVKKFSVRVCVFIGITMGTIGYAISSFATSLEFLIASQSIIVGAGIALYSMPIFILIEEYFDKRKGVANAVYIAGNSLGGVIMPFLYRYVFDEYGLNGGLLITAGITFNSLVAATLLRPPEFYMRNEPKSSDSSNEVHGNEHCENVTDNSETSVRLPSEIIYDRDEMNNDNETLVRICHSSHVRNHNDCDIISTTIQNSGLDSSQSLLAHNSIIEADYNICHEDQISHSNEVVDNEHCENVTDNSETSVRLLPEIIYDRDEMNSDTSHNETLVRICHSSLVRNHNNCDITSTTTQASGLDSSQSLSAHKCNMRKRLSSCKRIMDCSVMTNISYVLFLGIHCLGSVAIMSGHIYTPAYAKDIGIDDGRIAVLLSIAGTADFLGRIFCGFLVDSSRITPQRIIMFSQIVVGTVVQFMPIYTTFWHLVVFVVIYGSTAGLIVSVFPAMLRNIIGKDNYANALAIYIVIINVFGAAVLPILGYFRDITNTYHVTFHVMGACSLSCVVLLIVFEVIRKRGPRATDSG